ncbi:MAG: hypothetical protein LBQ84_09375 [Flavobacteriaceae bacterium]|nr:hypothetical protein [Flavobacteriaceae bacterium]
MVYLTQSDLSLVLFFVVLTGAFVFLATVFLVWVIFFFPDVDFGTFLVLETDWDETVLWVFFTDFFVWECSGRKKPIHKKRNIILFI